LKIKLIPMAKQLVAAIYIFSKTNNITIEGAI